MSNLKEWFDRNFRGIEPGEDVQLAKAMRNPSPDVGVPIGDFNEMIGIYAPRGYGKSSKALDIAEELQEAGPAYVIAHDPGFRLPPNRPDGSPRPIVRHKTRQSVLTALQTHPTGIQAWGGQFEREDGTRETITSEQVIELATEVAARSKVAAGQAHGLEDVTSPDDFRLAGLPAIPVVVLIDEAVMARGASKNRMSPEMRDFLISLRHLHVGLVYTAQGGGMVHYDMVQLATELYLGKSIHTRAHKAFEDAGVPADVIAKLPTMERFQFERVLIG